MNEQKTILFDGRFLSLSNAGLGRYSSELIKNLLIKNKDKEFKYIILVLPGAKFEKTLVEAIKESDSAVEIIELDAKHYSLKEQTKLRDLLNTIKPDLVHFTNLNHPVLYKGQFVITIHDLTLFQYSERAGILKKLAYNYVINNAARNSKKIFTVSEYAKKELINKFDLPVNKVAVTYNGIDEKFQKITNPQTLQKTTKYNLYKPYFLYVGQWRSHKNLLVLVEAFANLLKNDLEGKVELVFAGKKDSKYPELINKIKELKIEDSVKFTGFVEDEDLPVLYNNALAFVFPSLSEGFGLPALEAQACSTPVIAAEATSLPEVLDKGALYFDPKSTKSLEKKMLQIMIDENLKADLVKKGLENVKRFSWEDTAEKTLEVYRHLLYK